MSETIPSGCRHCGLGPRLHFQRWASDVGWHVFTEPTCDQIVERMRIRYAARLKGAMSDQNTGATLLCLTGIPQDVADRAGLSRDALCALPAGHADPTHDDGHGLSWQGPPFPPDTPHVHFSPIQRCGSCMGTDRVLGDPPLCSNCAACGSVTPFSPVAIAPRTALERAADEPNGDLDRLAAMQGVQPVTSIDQLTAPEGERVGDEEWTAYAEALGIETGGEQGDGRDHTFEMLDDDAPKQNPRAVAEYWHEWADTCSNGGRDAEWTTVAQVVGRILAAMDGEQGEREGGSDAQAV